jgi:hypothetical protein
MTERLAPKTVFIVGTWHHFMEGVPPPRSCRHFQGFEDHLRHFDQLVRGIIRTNRIIAVVQEVGDDYLAQDLRGEATRLRKIADSLGVRWKNTDLTQLEREQRGLKTDAPKGTPAWLKLQDAREAHWLKCLHTLDMWPVLFVCGGCHSVRFRNLLVRDGLDARIEVERWEPS